MSKASGHSPISKHLYANLYDVDYRSISDETSLAETIGRVLREEGVEPVEVKSWSFGGRKGGVSVIVVLEGAHVIIHTWVEYRYATLDVLVTGDRDPERVFRKLLEVLKPRSYKVGYTHRGELSSGRR
ncbi:MAG: adenosylmethionine decarboxylase [Sulfolobales archaeon]|nr:adenosylmethionine decarboxylase [Sulfolobales archaeon]MCX8209020.1 adenosylmethionine decarboxylase [Sulfolobales archaeon]MDW8010302.1 adenosylmethionine decarboxylase [Sulfolobales archaeon]